MERSEQDTIASLPTEKASPISVERIYEWSTAESQTSSSLFAVGGDEQLSRGWAAGSGGILLEYKDRRWYVHKHASELTEKSLRALWFNEHVTEGWAVGDGGVILEYEDDKWKLNSDPGEVTDRSLHALWLKEDGSKGWAVGSDGVVLTYESGRWSLHPGSEAVTDKSLNAVSFSDDAKLGWAVGDDGIVLRHEEGNWLIDKSGLEIATSLYTIWTKSRGLHTRMLAAGESGTILEYNERTRTKSWVQEEIGTQRTILSLWLDDEETGGWAVGAARVVPRFSLADLLWGRSPDLRVVGSAEGPTFRFSGAQWLDSGPSSNHGDSHAMWIAGSGSSGWAVGADGMILQLSSSLLSDLHIFAENDADISRLSGRLRLVFPVDVRRPDLKVFPNDSSEISCNRAGLLSSGAYDVTKKPGDSRQYTLQFVDHGMLFTRGFYKLLFCTTTVGGFPISVSFGFDKRLHKLIGLLDVVRTIALIFVSIMGLNLILLIVATRVRAVRSIFFHRYGSIVLSLVLGRYILTDPLLTFVDPLRYGLMRDYKKTIANQPSIFGDWESRRYITPLVELSGSDVIDDTSTAEDGGEGQTSSEQVLDTIISSGPNKIWTIIGSSGLGKTALLENWVPKAAERGYIPFLIRLGESHSIPVEITLLLTQHGDIPWSADSRVDVRRTKSLIDRGRFILLIDGLNEDLSPEKTQAFIRGVQRRNIVVVTSQFAPNWKNVSLAPIRLHRFGRQQLESIIPAKMVESILKEEHLKSIIDLPQSAQLLADYIAKWQKLPGSASDVYEFLIPHLESRERGNVERQAWELFLSGERQFLPSNAMPESDVCSMAVRSGLLTRRREGAATVFRFVHDRVHSYLVACYLLSTRTDAVTSWIEESRSRDRRVWDDVLEHCAGLIADKKHQYLYESGHYIGFLKDVADVYIDVFRERLYRQYLRLVASKRFDRDIEFESWSAEKLAN